MAPLFVSLNKTAPWSPCSAIYITEFFDNGHGRKYSRLSPRRVKNDKPGESETELPCKDCLPTWTSAMTLWLLLGLIHTGTKQTVSPLVL